MSASKPTNVKAASDRRSSGRFCSSNFRGRRAKNPATTARAKPPPARVGAASKPKATGSNASDQLPCSLGTTKRQTSRGLSVSGISRSAFTALPYPSPRRTALTPVKVLAQAPALADKRPRDRSPPAKPGWGTAWEPGWARHAPPAERGRRPQPPDRREDANQSR